MRVLYIFAVIVNGTLLSSDEIQARMYQAETGEFLLKVRDLVSEVRVLWNKNFLRRKISPAPK